MATRLGICTLGVIMLAGTGVASAQETSEDPYFMGDDSGKGPNLQIPGQAWQTNYEANPVEGQENIPFEFVAGFPTTLIELLNPPVACEVWAAQYYNNLFEEGVLATTGLYYNRTLARARNPEDGGKGVGGSPQRTPYREAGPGTKEGGPYALSECPNRGTAHAFARGTGITGDGFQVAYGYSESKARVDPKSKKSSGELIADVTDVTLPDSAVSFKHMHSVLEITHLPDSEPTFKYELTLEGLVAGGQEIFGFGDKGFKVGGQGPGPEAVKQFNEGAAAYSKQFEAAFIYGFRIAEPRFYVDTAFDKFNFISPVVEGSIAFPARKGTIGDFQALRFGKNAYRGVYKTVTDDEEYLGTEGVTVIDE